MSELQQLIGAVRQMLPGVHIEVDEPDPDTSGSTFVMFDLGGHVVDLQWRPGRGFGVSCTDETPGLGEGPEEVYEDWTQAGARIATLLAFRKHTVPRRVVLGHVRDLLGVSQAELARRMRVQQAAVSKVERREDHPLASVWRYIEALGGTTEGLLARFGDEEYIIVLFLLAKEVQERIEIASRLTADLEERRRAADFLRRTMASIREVGRALKMPDLAARAESAIRDAEAA